MIEKQKFGYMDFIKKVAVIAIPVALQNLLTTTSSMIDTIMISSAAENAIGAVGLCAQFSGLMFSCYWGFVGGGMLFISQYWGSKDEKGINRSYGITLSFMMTVALIFGSIAHFFPEFVMKIYTDKPQFWEIGKPYLKIVGFAYPLQVLSMGMSCLLRATERVVIPLVASIGSVITNIFLNWILIYGNLGAPKMGVRGAAIATTVAALVNVIIIVVMAMLSKYPYLFKIKEHFNWNREFLGVYIKKCFPIICNELFVGVGNCLINIVLGHQSAEAIDAIAVFRTIEGLIIGFFAGFSNAASILVGKSVGAGELDIAYERAKRLVYMCQGVIAMIVATLLIFIKPFLHLMNLNGDSFIIGRGLIIIYGIFCIIRMGNWTMNDTYRSAGDAVTGTTLEIVFLYIMVLPAIFIAWKKFNAPIFVVFALCYVDEPIRYFLMQRHMYSAKWIRPVTQIGKDKLKEFISNKKTLKE